VLDPHRRRHPVARPRSTGWGLDWGYRGSGCHALATLLDVLLDDISAPAVSPRSPYALFELLRDAP
jgi:hypothetical protein